MPVSCVNQFHPLSRSIYSSMVPKVIDFPRYIMKCTGKARHYAEYFMLYLVFLYISCYIAEILITFWAVYSKDDLRFLLSRPACRRRQADPGGPLSPAAPPSLEYPELLCLLEAQTVRVGPSLLSAPAYPRQ